MARSRNKYSRARMRSKIRRPRKRGGSTWFYAALACIVIAGTAGIAFTVGGSADVHPLVLNAANGQGDHWHAALGVDVCGQWLANPTQFLQQHDNPNVYAGLHTHSDGFVHVEAATRSEAGDNATFGRFLTYGGWSASDTSFNLWAGPAAAPTKTSWQNGDKCPAGTNMAGQTGFVKWSVDCRAQKGDPSGWKIHDHGVIALGFLPKGKDIPVPPNATAAPVSEKGSPLTNFKVQGCTTAGPGGTLPSTTTSTAPAATTTPSSKP
jgi:hypothetical protein